MRPLIEHRRADHEQRLLRALAMQRIIITRGLGGSDRLVQRLTQLGAAVVHCPCVAVLPPHDDRPLEQAAKRASSYDWLLFTSPNAVEAFSARVSGDIPRISLRVAVGAVGNSTAEAARALGWQVRFVPVQHSGIGLARELPVTNTPRVLLPRADIASAELPEVLRSRGCVVTEVVAYRTVDATTDLTVAQLRALVHVDAICFSSPSTVRHFQAAAHRARWDLSRAQREDDVSVVCIGATTADEARRHGLCVNAIAREPSSEGVVEALASVLASRARMPDGEDPETWSI